MLVQFVYYENISLFKQSSHLGCLFLWKMQIFYFFIFLKMGNKIERLGFISGRNWDMENREVKRKGMIK